jgi:hypothetical protein
VSPSIPALTLGVLAFALSSSGCGARPKTVRDLSTPIYEWAIEKGACGTTLVVDSHADLWREVGCEGSTSRLTKVRHLDPAPMRRIVVAFEALPQREPLVCADNANAHMFFRHQNDIASVWHVCLPEEQHLPDPFAEIARAFGGEP